MNPWLEKNAKIRAWLAEHPEDAAKLIGPRGTIDRRVLLDLGRKLRDDGIYSQTTSDRTIVGSLIGHLTRKPLKETK